ncbi:single-stranded DNA-binding protein [Streptomyces sp. NPDC018045]|uniref:single-stranded DNA-binding protein n=1 Tax=Streptomyces sp. NPDC018045 TaxID=3365037 RepID=UPI00379E953D
MYETMVTLVGNAATAVEHRQTTTGASAVRFRLATSARRWDKERGCWVDGDTSFYTVRAWRALADHVAASVSRGEPLVVHGRMRVWDRELPEEKGGQRRVSVEVDAVAVGHDLSRGTSAFRRTNRTSTGSAPPNVPALDPEAPAAQAFSPAPAAAAEPDWASPPPPTGTPSVSRSQNPKPDSEADAASTPDGNDDDHRAAPAASDSQEPSIAAH